MYQNIFIDRKTATAHVWDDVNGYETVPFTNYAYRRRAGGKYRSIYGDELEKVTYFSPNDPSLLESDVNPETRVLIDLYEDSDEVSTGHVVGIIDIETDSTGGFPSVERGDKEITAISIHNSKTNRYTAMLLDREGRGTIKSNHEVDISYFKNEETLLEFFLDHWERSKFTIISGWNIDGFDMPYLFNRIRRVLGEHHCRRLSPIKICYMNDWSKRLIVAGISCLDYMELFKKFSEKKEPSYALGNIGKKFVNIEKISYKGDLNELYRSDLNKYLEYNLNDVKIVVALENKLQYIGLAQKICHIGHVSYESFRWSSRYIEGAILTYLRRNGNLVAPSKSLTGADEYEQQLADDEEGFEGAYVKDPIPGRYDWIYDLDLTSMYPNIIISLNISPETKLGKVDVWDSRKFADRVCENISVAGSKYTVDEFDKFIHENNICVASNGVMYKLPNKVIVGKIKNHSSINKIKQ